MRNSLRDKYNAHKGDAKRRGIEFLLTFEEWSDIWIKSGHLHERGCRHDQYVMARFGDKGPYSVGNVRITTSNENNRERNLAFTHSDETKKRLSQMNKGKPGYWLGRPKSDETKAKLSVANKGKPGFWLGRKRSEETKKKISVTLKSKHDPFPYPSPGQSGFSN